MRAAILLIGISCRPPGEELDSDDWGAKGEDSGGGSETGDSALGVSGLTSSEGSRQPGDSDEADSGAELGALVATDAGGGRVEVEHSGVDGPCGATWTVTAAVSAEREAWIDVTYAPDAAETGDGTCAWTFAYAIENVMPDLWTIAAAGDETQVIVEP